MPAAFISLNVWGLIAPSCQAPLDLTALCAGCVPADKAQQMSDWACRPLTDRQKTYAALDAFVLPKLYDVLQQRLGPETTQQLVQQHTKTYSRVSGTSKQGWLAWQLCMQGG